MSTVTEAVDAPVRRSTGRVVAAAILGVIGILLIIASIIYFTTAAHSLPSILGQIKYTGHNHSRAYDKRPDRGIAALAAGVICLVAAGFAYFWKAKKADI